MKNMILEDLLSKRLTAPLKVRRLPLSDIWLNMQEAHDRVCDYTLVLYGEFPVLAILDKASYQLMAIYYTVKGHFSSGDWLDVPIFIGWEWDAEANELVFVGINDDVLGWAVGSELCYLTEEHFNEMHKYETQLKKAYMFLEHSKN